VPRRVLALDPVSLRLKRVTEPILAVARSVALGVSQALHGEPPRAATCSYPAPRSERSRRFNLIETGSKRTLRNDADHALTCDRWVIALLQNRKYPAIRWGNIGDRPIAVRAWHSAQSTAPAQRNRPRVRHDWGGLWRGSFGFCHADKDTKDTKRGVVTVSFVALGLDDFRRLSCSGAGGSVAALGRALCRSATRLRPAPEYSVTQPRSKATFDHFGCARHFWHPSRPPSPARKRDQTRQPLGHPPRNATVATRSKRADI
jgi:hypothetical protein